MVTALRWGGDEKRLKDPSLSLPPKDTDHHLPNNSHSYVEQQGREKFPC